MHKTIQTFSICVIIIIIGTILLTGCSSSKYEKESFNILPKQEEKDYHCGACAGTKKACEDLGFKCYPK